MTKYLFVILFTGMSQVTVAQDYAFKVLISKGDNEVRSGQQWMPVKVGSSLSSEDELKVPENSYLGLVHISGKPLEIKESGNYKVSELSARMGKEASVLNKYTDFIMSTNSEKKSMNIMAAVHRGSDGITVYLPEGEHSFTFGENIILHWDTTPAPYIVNFTNVFGDPIHTQETDGTTLDLDLGDKKFAGQDNIVVVVSSKQKPNQTSDQHVLRRLPAERKKKVQALLMEVESYLSGENALNKLVLGGFFEQHGLLIDAATAYLQAIRLAPNVPYFAEAYRNFLIRNKVGYR